MTESAIIVTAFLDNNPCGKQMAVGWVQGLSDKAIAEELQVAAYQVTAAREKLQKESGLRNRAALVQGLEKVPGLMPVPS